MKFLVVISCLLAVACAKPGLVSPLGYSGVVPSSYGYSYSSHVAAPAVSYSAAHVGSPLAYSAAHIAAPYSAAHIAAPYSAAHFAAPYSAAHIAAPYSAVAHSAVAYSSPVAHSAHVVGPVAHSTVVGPSVHSVVAAAPVVAHHAAVVGVEKTQYHAQDTIGQAAYGHSEAFQTHNAVQDAHGNKIGSYSYVAPDGQVIAADYVADALGYRVASNAVPVESADIVAARAAHLAEVEVVKHRNRRSPVFAYGSPLAYHTAPISAYHASPFVARAGYGHVVAPHAYAYRYY